MRVKCPVQELNTVTSIWPQLFEGHSVTNHAIYLLDRDLSSGFMVLSTFRTTWAWSTAHNCNQPTMSPFHIV